jgi:hypothetical protein
MAARIGRQTSGAMRLDPWPFNSQYLDLEVPARSIKAGPYGNAEALKLAFDVAEPVIIRMRLCAWGSA